MQFVSCEAHTHTHYADVYSIAQTDKVYRHTVEQAKQVSYSAEIARVCAVMLPISVCCALSISEYSR